MEEKISEVSRAVYSVLKILILLVLIIGFFLLFVLSIVVHDTKYIQEFPNKFAIELFLISVLAAIPIFYIGYARDVSLKTTTIDFILLVIKFGLLHIGLQLSGFYTNMFEEVPEEKKDLKI